MSIGDLYYYEKMQIGGIFMLVLVNCNICIMNKCK